MEGLLWKAALFSEDSEVRELVLLTPEDDAVIWDEAGNAFCCSLGTTMTGACALEKRLGGRWAIFGPLRLGKCCNGMRKMARRWTTGNCASPNCWAYTRTRGTNSALRPSGLRPEDVIRPAYVTDVRAEMANDYSLVAGEYKIWFDANILWSYFESDYPDAAGYTYDWSGGESEYGLMEFWFAMERKPKSLLRFLPRRS